MVCSWLANSWAWARSTCAVERNDPISCSRSASAVRSRIVVTVPSTRSPLTTRMRAHHEHAAAADDHLVTGRGHVVVGLDAAGAPGPGVLADQHLAQPALDAQVVDRGADGVLGQVEQLAGDLVDEGDAVLGVEGDDALGDAAQHRLAVLGEAGDLARLHAASLALDPPREQPRPAEPDRERDAEVGEQVGGGALQPLPGRRHPLGDHHGAEVGAHGILATRRAPAPARRRWSTPSMLQGARPARAGLDPRAAQGQPAALDRRVGGDPHVEVGLGEAHRRDARLGDDALRQGRQAGAGLGLGEVGCAPAG